MARILMRLLNIALLVGYIAISLLRIESVPVLRQYMATLFAGWAILHTAILQRADDWRFEFAELPPSSIQLCHYTATAFLIGAALYCRLLSEQENTAAFLMMISIGLVWLKVGVTPKVRVVLT